MKPTVIRLAALDRARIEKLIEWGYGSRVADTVRRAILDAYGREEVAQFEKLGARMRSKRRF